MITNNINGENMTPENFCYWLQGFFEIVRNGNPSTEKITITDSQSKMIEEHLQMVFITKQLKETKSLQVKSPVIGSLPVSPGGQGTYSQSPFNFPVNWDGSPMVTC